MPIASHSYNAAAAALSPLLEGLPPVLVAIDGRSASGKTTLGRYLAWHFNVMLLETDVFLEAEGGFEYRWPELQRVVATRLSRNCPLLFEGVAAKWLLEQLGYTAAFTIYVSNSGPFGGETPSLHVQEYETRFKPVDSADLLVEVFH